jgi:NaMN:DMB phosphoribosyltransferase
MKRSMLLFVLLYTVCSFYTAIAQVKIISLNKNNGLLAIPSRIVVFPGDSVQFKAIDGDFDIYIVDAIRIFKIKVPDLKVRVNSSSNAESEIYVVREVDEYIEKTYSIYCITSNVWPDAPPKIIIVSH